MPCKSCSFWADNFNGIVAHLNQRDVTMVAVSRAPLAKIAGVPEADGLDASNGLSSGDSDFNYDYGVSFRPQRLAAGEVDYNYQQDRRRR